MTFHICLAAHGVMGPWKRAEEKPRREMNGWRLERDRKPAGAYGKTGLRFYYLRIIKTMTKMIQSEFKIQAH